MAIIRIRVKATVGFNACFRYAYSKHKASIQEMSNIQHLLCMFTWQ
jgi:hypothetical protein